jgi:tryptophan-rich sensory protein
MAKYNVRQADGSVITIDDSDRKKQEDVAVGMGIFAMLWALLGIAAFITSIVCWAKAPQNLGSNIGMFIVALLLGPLYFLVMPFAMKGGYCKSAKASRSRRSSR